MKQRNIIIIGVIIVLLIAICGLFLMNQPANNTENSTSSNNTSTNTTNLTSSDFEKIDEISDNSDNSESDDSSTKNPTDSQNSQSDDSASNNNEIEKDNADIDYSKAEGWKWSESAQRYVHEYDDDDGTHHVLSSESTDGAIDDLEYKKDGSVYLNGKDITDEYKTYYN